MRTMRRLISICLLVAAGAIANNAIANNIIKLLSAGSTFIYPILGRWCTEYRKLHPELQISYEPVGSGHGIARTMAGTVDFGASDSPMTDVEATKPTIRSLSFRLC